MLDTDTRTKGEFDIVPILPKSCPVCGVATNYVYCIAEGDTGKQAKWYRCQCGLVFQEEFPSHKGYDKKYFDDYACMKEGDKRLTHSARIYGNLIEELTYGRMMLDVGYCVPHNMDFFAKRGWLTWGIDVNEQVGGNGRFYRGDFITYDFDIPANTEDLKALAEGDKFKRTFDLIWMNHSFEHFNYPLAALKKAYDLLSDTGVLFIALPDIDFIMKTGVTGYPHFKMDEHFTLWGEAVLKREVERIGMKVIMCRRNFSSRFSSWYDIQLIAQRNYF
jgi:SAM-dependent methyltransferase